MNDIILLGTKGGPAIRKGGALPTASLLRLGGRTILIDCAIGAARSAVEAGVGLLEIDEIFITHLHSDHVLELGPLIYTAWTTGLQRQITVYGPPGIEGYWQGFMASMAFDYKIRLADEGRPSLTDLVRIVSYTEGPVMQDDGLSVAALRVDHPPVTDCFALRFAGAGATVVFSSDTCYFPPLGDFAKDADVLVHEAMLTDGVEALIQRTPGASRLREHLYASHTRAEDVGRIATAAGVGHLVLNHLLPADDPNFSQSDWHAAIQPTWTGPLTVGRDGLRIPLS